MFYKQKFIKKPTQDTEVSQLIGILQDKNKERIVALSKLNDLFEMDSFPKILDMNEENKLYQNLVLMSIKERKRIIIEDSAIELLSVCFIISESESPLVYTTETSPNHQSNIILNHCSKLMHHWFPSFTFCSTRNSYFMTLRQLFYIFFQHLSLNYFKDQTDYQSFTNLYIVIRAQFRQSLDNNLERTQSRNLQRTLRTVSQKTEINTNIFQKEKVKKEFVLSSPQSYKKNNQKCNQSPNHVHAKPKPLKDQVTQKNFISAKVQEQFKAYNIMDIDLQNIEKIIISKQRISNQKTKVYQHQLLVEYLQKNQRIQNTIQNYKYISAYIISVRARRIRSLYSNNNLTQPDLKEQSKTLYFIPNKGNLFELGVPNLILPNKPIYQRPHSSYQQQKIMFQSNIKTTLQYNNSNLITYLKYWQNRSASPQKKIQNKLKQQIILKDCLYFKNE